MTGERMQELPRSMILYRFFGESAYPEEQPLVPTPPKPRNHMRRA
jgi:hypothetical protein